MARGIAALLVVLFHATILVSAPKYWGVAPAWGAFTFGHAGVYFFFVLSGFIILRAHRGDIGHPEKLTRYAWKRVIRIYPPLWITLLLVLPLLSLTGQRPPSSAVLTSFALVGLDATSIIAVGWTLFHEILFYTLFATLIAGRRVGIAVLATWAITCIAGYWWETYQLSVLNLLFLAGALVEVASRSGKVRAPALMLALGVSTFLATGYWQLHEVGRQLEPGEVHGVLRFIVGYAVGSCLSLLGAVELESRGRLAVPRPASLLGDASYSVYLVHYPVLSVSAKVLRGLPVEAAFVILTFIATAAGVVFWRFVEKPVTATLQRKLIRPRR